MNVQHQDRKVITSGKLAGQPSMRALILADVCARGRLLTPEETREVCLALRAQSMVVRNHFKGN